jgi:hypothetical protein
MQHKSALTENKRSTELIGIDSKQELTCELELALCLLTHLYKQELGNLLQDLAFHKDLVWQSRQMEHCAIKQHSMMTSDAISTMELLFAIFRTTYSPKLGVRYATYTTFTDLTLGFTEKLLRRQCQG